MNASIPAAEKPIQRRVFIVATAGHVDHGKSSLVRELTGVETDTLREEKDRGLTINLGFAYAQHKFEQQKPITVGFIDVPGHRDFIHNMLAGVSAIDAALLVIAADDGIMPQTLEHLQILNLLQVSQLVIAISKVDKCEAERVTEVTQEIQQLISAQRFKDSPVIHTSTATQTGIEELRAKLFKLAEEPQSAQPDKSLFRFQIDRSFSVKGIGTVVTGSAVAGQCGKDEVLLHSRTETECRIRGLRLDTENLDEVSSGERAAINITALDPDSISRGDWLIDPWLLNPVQRIDAKISWLTDKPPSTGAQYHLHLGAAHHLVSVRQLSDEYPDWMQIRSHQPMHCHFGDRFILRDPTGQATIGGGEVIDIHVPRKHRASAQRLAQLLAMDDSAENSLCSLLQLQQSGVDLVQFRRNRNLSQTGLEHCLQSCRDKGLQILRIQHQTIDQGFSKEHFEQGSRQILHALAEFHEANPSASGLSDAGLSKAIAFNEPFKLLKAILEKLLDLKLLARSGSVLRLPGHITQESAEEKLFIAELEPLLRKAGQIPPRTRELADETGIALSKLEQVLKQCVRTGRLIRVADNRHFLPETIEELAGFIETLADNETEAGFSVIQFRDASGIGRNLCIEILEYFDHIGFTRREGNSRHLRTNKENFFN